jgi:hypothetical protein
LRLIDEAVDRIRLLRPTDPAEGGRTVRRLDPMQDLAQQLVVVQLADSGMSSRPSAPNSTFKTTSMPSSNPYAFTA